MPSKLISNSRNVVLNAIAWIILLRTAPKQKNGRRPQKPMGPHKNQSASASGKGKDSTLSAHSARAAAEIESGGKVKRRKLKGALYLNLDPFQHYIGPKNWSEVIIDGELTTCLLDNGSQLNFMTLHTQLREASISCLSTTLLRNLVELCHQLTASEEALLNPRGL